MAEEVAEGTGDGVYGWVKERAGIPAGPSWSGTSHGLTCRLFLGKIHVPAKQYREGCKLPDWYLSIRSFG